MTKKTGTIKSKARVPNSKPPTVPTPTEILPLAPTPDANISGNIPNTIVADVMMIGLKRAFAAEIADATSPIPSFLRAVAYSVNRIAVFASNPINIISPICMYILFSRPHQRAKRKLPAKPIGTAAITAKGTVRLSYKAHNIRYIKARQILNTMMVILPVDDSSLDIPPNSYPNPEGRYFPATSLMALMASPEL